MLKVNYDYAELNRIYSIGFEGFHKNRGDFWKKYNPNPLLHFCDLVRTSAKGEQPVIGDVGCFEGTDLMVFRDTLATVELHGCDPCEEGVAVCRERGFENVEETTFTNWHPRISRERFHGLWCHFSLIHIPPSSNELAWARENQDLVVDLLPDDDLDRNLSRLAELLDDDGWLDIGFKMKLSPGPVEFESQPSHWPGMPDRPTWVWSLDGMLAATRRAGFCLRHSYLFERGNRNYLHAHLFLQLDRGEER